ncbi:MAG: SDR family NAD(P)-dependent oxidoreductase [Muribaculaceae bacterium]|nr:SDR family NAD(P)-dependent oxidoreductase [Muribaculaceae bacterium]
MSSFSDLSSHTALVTGAAGGIGLEFAKLLAKQGADVIMLDVSEERLTQARKQIDGNAYLLKCDLTSPSFITEIENFCTTHSLNPDILINNAGIFSFKPIADTAISKIETFIALHVSAVTLLSQWFVSRRKEFGSGWMLNMSSMSCWMPMPGLAMYSSTKSYIRVFTRALHYEVKDSGIGVTVACPGGIATDLFGLPKKWQKFAVSIGVLQTPETFAGNALKRMLKKKKQYINGWLNRFSIFFVGILPTNVRMMVKHRLLDRGISR